MNTAKIADLIPGVTVYYVTIIPDFKTDTLGSYISEYLLCGLPYKENHLGLFIEYFSRKYGYINKFSLGDCNVEPNTYNVHQLFLSKDDAQSYIERMNDPSQWSEHEATILNKWMLQQKRDFLNGYY